jgi:protein TonB
VEGTLIAKCFITVEGTARNCRILKHLPFMDEAAIGFLERCRYSPATYRGKPIEGDMAFSLRLRLPPVDAGFQGVPEDSAKVRK